MDARARLGWVRLYEQLGDAGVVCLRCGISRPTLRKWWRRYRAEGLAGLEARSHRPHRSPGRKVFAEQEALILRLRRERKLGIIWGSQRRFHLAGPAAAGYGLT